MRFEFSAGGVVFKKNDGLEVLLIQPEDTTRPKGWSLPKGKIEKEEKAEAAALREVQEETGIEAEIVQKIDDIGYFFKDKWGDGVLVKKKVTYYLMNYVSGEPEKQAGETSAAAWLKIDDASKQMAYKDERAILEKALKIIPNS
ncbi:MAG: hypothetical protein A3J48_00590 [Candidatus Doudnabacteria bacterium RIFCSPHIGHO2_02_FULL_46_11]|uniref:Nudix hydrolase domain-containing protein n=1 Tax=Candidatus Doudnabacteria bacterium RIFCSPHIGHO2_02_FULL_46_11 TaxID=1817832 RepID=A0A1F5P534_9BACT|nr:MAG: hypothetical protein A3J48_00590 [Candidatus Doudnabacteria bacterium RIFCSPHIGHO2_02_FULL_46_11]